MFDRFSRGPRRSFWQQLRMRRGEWTPEIDVFEQDNVTAVHADVPGVKRRDFDVSVEGNTLHIEGRREEEQAKEADYYSERPFGRFSRTVQFPEGIDQSAIEASYQDGVLELKMPRAALEPRKSVRVPIQ